MNPIPVSSILVARIRSRLRLMTRCRIALMAVAAVLALGCGEKSAEEMLQDANQELTAAAQTKEAAKVALDQLDARLAEVQAGRDKAAEAYEQARQRWLGAKDAVGEFATDEVLHRQVNRALLEAPELQGSTITAQVESRLVILVGVAADRAAADRAEELAQEVPGVAEVISQLRVGTDADEQTDAASEPDPGPGSDALDETPELDIGPDPDLEADETPAVPETQI